MKVKTFLTLIALCLLLVGCGEKAVRQPDSKTTGTDPTIPARKTPVQKKWGGGYYKDDGPGDIIPEGLDQIPDAVPRTEPLHRFANRPYIVLGKSYTPDTRLKPFKQRGTASWYGKKFHGQKTSIGETYDMFAMTAAHPTLALPSYVRVTNLGNGKSVTVRVNDRGPFHADRIIDLSYAAAYRLDYIGNGSTSVEVETFTEQDIRQMVSAPPPLLSEQPDEIERFALAAIEKPEPVTAPAFTGITAASTEQKTLTTVGKKEIFLQLGAFSNIENAENLKSHLSRELDWLNENIQITPGGLMYRVHLGPYENRSGAEQVAEKIYQETGMRPGIIQR